jgi:hypothetical protein
VDPARLVEAAGQPVLQEVEERVDGGQAGVAGAGRVAALALEVLEEGQDQRRIQLLELEPARLDREPARREPDQEL